MLTKRQPHLWVEKRNGLWLGRVRGGGGGGTQILSYMYLRRLVHFWVVQYFKFQYFWGFQKNEYFLGNEEFVDIFWGHHKIGLHLGVISMHLRVFS